MSVVPWLRWKLCFLSEAGCAPREQELGRCRLEVSRRGDGHRHLPPPTPQAQDPALCVPGGWQPGLPHPPTPPAFTCYHCITVPLSLPPSPALQTWCLSSGCLEVTGAGAWDERSSLGLAEWETRDEPAAPRSRAVLRGQSRGLSEIQKQGNVFGLVSDFWGVFFLAYLPPPPRNCRLLSFVFVSLRMQRRDLTRS